MKTCILILKGFIVGLAKIIPGVSGAILAISMGLYDKAIMAITEFFSDIKKNVKFLLPIGTGIILAMIIGSKILVIALSKYYVMTMLFFIGLIMGSVPMIYQKTNKSKNGILIVIVSFLFMFLLSVSSIDNTYIANNKIVDYFMYFISGVIDAVGTVVPGLSSTALLMILGTYDIIIATISNISNIDMVTSNIEVLMFYSLGMIIGIVLISLLINYLFKKYNDKVYSFIFGILLSSVVLLLLKTIFNIIIIKDLIIGLILLSLGILITRYFGD